MTIDESNPPETADQDGTRTLVLMRHAKSDWRDGSLADHDRPLNARGRDSAPRMAVWLSDVRVVPDMVLCSSSVRTRETLQRMLPMWSTEPVVCISESLYLAPASTILETVRNDGGDAKTLLVLAHNPGMADLVSNLGREIIDMPTAAAAVFDVRVDAWQLLRDAGELSRTHFMRPKALN